MKQLWSSVLVTVLVTALAIPAVAERSNRGANRPTMKNMGPAKEQGQRHQGPRGGAGRFVEQMLQPRVAEAIGLNEAQVTVLKQGLEENRAKESALIKKLQAAGKRGAKIMSAKGEIDEAALMKAIEATGRIRTQMAKLRVRPILLVKKTLTEEQLAEAKKMVHKRMEKRREAWSAQRGGAQDRQKQDRRWSRDRQSQRPGMDPLPPEEPPVGPPPGE